MELFLKFLFEKPAFKFMSLLIKSKNNSKEKLIVISGMNWEIGIDICTLLILCIKQITSGNLLYTMGNSTQCSMVPLMGRKSKKRGDICIRIADSLCCTVETNTTL